MTYGLTLLYLMPTKNYRPCAFMRLGGTECCKESRKKRLNEVINELEVKVFN
jgi:hypothetical protein